MGKREVQKACAANVRVHKMHKCTHEWDMVCPWHSASVSDQSVWKAESQKHEGYTGYCEAMSVIKLANASSLVFPQRSRHMNSSK